MKNIYKALFLFSFAALYCLLYTSCDKENPSDSGILQKELILISDTILPFSEPSGIAYSDILQKLWIVSGGNQHVYMLDTNGNVEKKLNYTGTDLEGITFDATDSTLWIIDEATKEISHLDLEGNVLFQKQLVYSSKDNKGPEGITIGENHTLYIINEKDPSVLLELNDTFQIKHEYQLDFALDYSDIAYDSTNNSFYLLSDESKALFVWNKQQSAICKYSLPEVANEGIAYNRQRDVFYIVNDATDQLFIYRKK